MVQIACQAPPNKQMSDICDVCLACAMGWVELQVALAMNQAPSGPAGQDQESEAWGFMARFAKLGQTNIYKAGPELGTYQTH